MHTTSADPAIVAALIYGQTLPEPRPSAVILHADQTVSWDAGEEVFTPRRSRAKGGQRDLAVAALRERRADRIIDAMARSNCANANACGVADLCAVVLCLAKAPFPLGGAAGLFIAARAQIEAAFLRRAAASLAGEVFNPAPESLDGWLLGFTDTTLGQLRRWLVARAGEGCNAPTDSYLRLAAWCAQNPGATADDVPLDYRY